MLGLVSTLDPSPLLALALGRARRVNSHHTFVGGVVVLGFKVSMSDLWWLGVILITAGSIGNNLGNNLVSLSFKKEDEESKAKKESSGDAQDDSKPEGYSGEQIPSREYIQHMMNKSVHQSMRDMSKRWSRRPELHELPSSHKSQKKIDTTTGSIEEQKSLEPTTPSTPSTPYQIKQTVASLDSRDGSVDAIITPPSTESPVEEKQTLQQKSLWVMGTVIFVSGNLLTFVAFGFGSQSLLASLESVQFLSNVFFISLVHGEKVTWRILFATLGIIIGCILVVIFSDHAATLYDSHAINQIYLTNTG